MELRVIVLTSDPGLSELLRAQVENLGCATNTARSYDEAVGVLEWADAALVDLADQGLHDLRRLRDAAPDVRTLAVVTEEEQAEEAAELADSVLVEPFSIPDLLASIRQLARPAGGELIDLRSGDRTSAPEPDDAPWWATR
jgi:DNA-binding response OmpR family regulator